MRTQTPLLEETDASAPAPAMRPPPPPAINPLPTPLQFTVMGALFVLGAVLALLGALLDLPIEDQLEHGGFFLGTYAFVVAASWLPPSVLSRRVDALLEKWVRGSSGGYYGVMALATFALIECRGLIDSVTGFEFSTGLVRNVIVHWVTGVSIDAIKNFVMSMAWPMVVLAGQDSIHAGGLVLATLAVFRFGARVLPHASIEQASKKAHGRKPKASRKR